ncbi:MAG: hypothetical protein NW226_26470 [Microscillaceae bacterium]|nr:hypothetical protein [Microscillaceae bacterium]
MNKRLKIILIYISLFSYLILSNVAAYSSYLEKSFAEKANTEKSSKSAQENNSEDQTVILPDFTLEAVVHSPSILPMQAFLVIYPIPEPILEITFPFEDTPRPLISYLIKTFCKIIVINAP